MKQILFIYLFFALLIPCEPGYENFIDQCYFSSDVDILREILDNSLETVNMDMDNPSWFSNTSLGNGNGIIEPLEICSQEWENGRLVTLYCGAHVSNGDYHWCNLSGPLPNTMINWSEIQSLNLEYNNFSGLVPDNICSMDLDFSDPSIFSLSGNNLCPPYPECIEVYMGWQNTWYANCELNECYDVGINDFIAFEIDGDNLVNPAEDLEGVSYLGINLFNDGPYCGQYPGIRIETETDGVSIQGLSLVDGGYETYWYGIPAQGQYGLLIQFDISPFVPEGTVISLTAEAVTLHCEEDCTGSEDPNCLTCPLTDPITLSLTVGDNFTNVPGDANFDGQVDVLDIVELVDHIINVEDYYDWNLMFIMSDLNGDYLLNIQDVIMMVGLILNND
jgi:hypothetical protein